jgi:hypothetical protein
MQESWWERPTCILCDWWWALLLGLILALAAYFTRGLWMPKMPVSPPTMPLPPPQTVTRPPARSTATLQPPTPTPTRVADLQTGDVQVMLIWSSTNDLDLWVTDPSGEIIYYSHNASQSGGELDVDANAGCAAPLTSQPVENIFWPTGGAPRGKYTIEVQYYEQCETIAPIDYQVTLLVDGEVGEFSGTILSQGDKQRVTSFER